MSDAHTHRENAASHCGHDPAQFVTGDEGTSYCPACERDAAERCACGADAGDHHFDRSICACGSMHYYCNQCGDLAVGETCDYAPPVSAGENAAKRRLPQAGFESFEEQADWWQMTCEWWHEQADRERARADSLAELAEKAWDHAEARHA